ncbi:MAG: sigma-54-dependent Fis family transcriptional regulator [Myxococcales bacterium]|nr:sigma-54-dependent Fis family transcriptional regulator [Myxococcales bacterium]
MNAVGRAMETTGAAPTRVLVVDDEEQIRRAWRWMLPQDEFLVAAAGDAEQALEVLRAERIDLVISDVTMPGIDGMRLLERIKKTRPGIEVILMTGYGSIQQAVEAIHAGAFDYLTKPFNDLDDCLKKVRQASAVKRLRDENLALRQQVDASPDSALLDTRSPAMRPVLARVAQVAKVDSGVLITGPTGVGKGILARAIHERSGRRSAPFVQVDCGAIPATLIESELFGHKKGAFTGAVSDKVGLFEQGNGGTVFLDEIGNMPLDLQTRLLKVLQDGRVRPVGGDRDVRVDVRVISATHVDLQAAIDAGSFRSDLYYRLNVVHIDVPPLADRREDVPALAYHFLARHAARLGLEVHTVSAECMDVLKRHAWSGNVRELENVIEAALVFAKGEELGIADLPEAVVEAARSADPDALDLSDVDLDLPFREAIDAADKAFRTRYLRGVMDRYRSVSAAARHAQMDRANFRRMLRRYDITDYPKGGEAG